MNPEGRSVEGKLDAWLFSDGDSRRLAGLRIGLFALLFIRLMRPIFVALSEQPPSLFRPISFMQLFDSMPGRNLVIALQIIAIVCAVLATLGVFARITMPMAWLACLPLFGMTTSVGKIVHNDVLLLLALVPVLFSPAADRWSFDRWRKSRRGFDAPADASPEYGWPIRSAMIVCSGAYFFAGLWKLVDTGPAWVFGDNMRWIILGAQNPSHPRQLAMLIATSAWAFHLIAAFTLLIEITFPIVLVRPKLTWLFVTSAVLVHIGIYLTMGLNYWVQAAVVVLVFFDFSLLAPLMRDLQAPRTGAGLRFQP